MSSPYITVIRTFLWICHFLKVNNGVFLSDVRFKFSLADTLGEQKKCLQCTAGTVWMFEGMVFWRRVQTAFAKVAISRAAVFLLWPLQEL